MTVRGKCLVERYDNKGALMSRELITNLIMDVKRLDTLKAFAEGANGSLKLTWMTTGVHNA